MEKGFFSMKEEPTGFAGGLWLMVIGTCMGLGFAGGYLVASNEASTASKKKQEEWSTKSKAYSMQEHKDTAELVSLGSLLMNREEELKGLRKKEAALARELKEMRETLDKEREKHASRMAETKPMLDLDHKQGSLLQQFLKAKQGFTNIKVELDAGHFKGLEDTDGFQILRAAFESVPEKK
jgi:hypothetical protein